MKPQCCPAKLILQRRAVIFPVSRSQLATLCGLVGFTDARPELNAVPFRGLHCSSTMLRQAIPWIARAKMEFLKLFYLGSVAAPFVLMSLSLYLEAIDADKKPSNSDLGK